jgi:hypothetical protein
MPEALRAWIEEEALPWMAWLAGEPYTRPAGRLDKKQRRKASGPTGHPPALTASERSTLAEARARLRVAPEGDGLVAAIREGRAALPEILWREALGLLSEPGSGVLRHLLATKPGGPADESAFAHGLVLALEGNFAVSEEFSGDLAEQALRRLVAAVGAMASLPPAESTRWKREVYRLLRAVEALTCLRAHGHLAPETEAVQDAIRALQQARTTLPDEVLQFAERTASTQQDEPLARAGAYLAGRYGDVAQME